MNYKNKLY